MAKVKKALSAYIFFGNDRRKALMEKDPSLKITDVAKLLGAEWKTMTDAQKQKYVDMATKDKTRYTDEKANASSESESEKKGKRKRGSKKDAKKKDPNAPKRPNSAWIFYSGEKRKELMADPAHKDKKMTELMSVISDAWKNEKEPVKQKYEKLAVAAKEKYEKDKAAYKPPAADTDSSDDESSDEEPKAKRGKAGSGKRASKRAGGKKKQESSSEEEESD